MPTRKPLPPARQTEVYHPEVLTPLLDPVIATLINSPGNTLTELVNNNGSPLNIVWPHAFILNTGALKSVLQAHDVRYAIFYGAKANKSQSMLSAALDAGIGVDVSSIYELEAALRAGVPGAGVCATGPAKTNAFHRALINAGSLICVDSPEEFDHLKTSVSSLPSPAQARILLRYRPQGGSKSRFGMGSQALLECLQLLAGQPETFVFEGFHFHLGGYGYESRVQAFREVTAFVTAAREMGLQPRMIDIGGGLPIRYVEPLAYNNFLQNHNKPSHYRNQVVPTSYYPYGSDLTAPQWLDLFLEANYSGDLTIADYLKTENMTLALEPGRSLVDQAAISVFRITRTKKLSDNSWVIFVEGSSFSACETWFSSEYLIDPILISRTDIPAKPARAYIAGHSCLDDDVITNRLIEFAKIPEAGDLLIYANTAGYQMDLLENEFHRHPMPKRLMAICSSDGHYTFSPDY